MFLQLTVIVDICKSNVYLKFVAKTLVVYPAQGQFSRSNLRYDPLGKGKLILSFQYACGIPRTESQKTLSPPTHALRFLKGRKPVDPGKCDQINPQLFSWSFNAIIANAVVVSWFNLLNDSVMIIVLENCHFFPKAK